MSAGRIGRWRNLPTNVRMAVRMIRSSARREYRVVLTTTVASSVGLLVLLLTGRELIRELSSDRLPESAWSLLPMIVLLGLATAAIGVASAVDTETRWMLGNLVEHRATDGIVQTAAAVPLAEFESPEFQDHLQRSLRQAVRAPWEITQAVAQLAGALAGSVVIAVVLVAVQPLLIPAVLLAGVPLAIAATRNSQALYDAIHAITPLNRERRYLQDVLTGRDEAKEIRSFGSAAYLRSRHDDRYRRELAALRKVSRLRAIRSVTAGLGASVITLAVLVVLIVMTVRGRVELADAAIGAVAVQQLAMRVRGANGAISSIQEESLFLEDYADFLARARNQEDRVTGDALLPGRPAGAVELDDVWFTYPGAETPALRGVDLTLEPGLVVALVGPNGSGKTTVAKLVCGLYEAERGRIAWGSGAPPRVAVVYQDFMRYELAARENIALGDTERIIDHEHVESSARAANADEFLAALPDGYDTWLTPSFEGGTDLSVGQWQRVALARALFREAPVLVLDEPTAALDPSAEHALIASAKRMFADKAVLVISHRFANVVDADRIHVLDDGRVIESGTHDELMSARGRYAEMYRLQAATFGMDVHD